MFSLPIPAQGTELKHRHFVLCVCVCVCVCVYTCISIYFLIIYQGNETIKFNLAFPGPKCCVQKGVSMKHIGGKRFIVCKT